MDQRDQFSKWMNAIEEALSDKKTDIAESMPVVGNECGCGSWDCPQCFPEQDQAPGGAIPAQIAIVAPCAGQQQGVCPSCGQPHPGNQGGEMSPLSMAGEVETEVPMQPEFDGELEEVSTDTISSYRDKAINQMGDFANRQARGSLSGREDTQWGNREIGIRQANTRLGLPKNDFDIDDEDDDYFNEPDAYDYDGGGAYGGRHDDYQSNLTARGLEEENPEETEVDPMARMPSDGRKGVKLGQIVQKFEPVGGDPAGEESPLTNGGDNLDENDFDDGPGPSDADLFDIESEPDANEDINAIMSMQAMGLSMSDTHYDERELYTLTPEQLQQVKAEVLGGQQAPMEEDDMMQDISAQAQQATGGTLGGATAQPGSGSGGYAPGTAPTMPESIQRNNTMENIDSDIARIMKGFTKYDALKASKAIVAEKKEVKEDDEKESGNPWAKGGSKSEDKKETKTSKGGTVTKTDTGLKHKGTYGDGKESKKDVKESVSEADPEVLEWMQRFSKLGNMSGYGR